MEASVQVVVGLILILVCSGMAATGRPARGMDHTPWLKNWLIGQTYVVTMLVIAVAGIGLIVSSFPKP
jgi:hypothetical protein